MSKPVVDIKIATVSEEDRRLRRSPRMSVTIQRTVLPFPDAPEFESAEAAKAWLQARIEDELLALLAYSGPIPISQAAWPLCYSEKGRERISRVLRDILNPDEIKP